MRPSIPIAIYILLLNESVCSGKLNRWDRGSPEAMVLLPEKSLYAAYSETQGLAQRSQYRTALSALAVQSRISTVVGVINAFRTEELKELSLSLYLPLTMT